MASADVPCSVRPGDGDVLLETVARIGGKLASEGGGGDAAAVVESLRELQGVHMTFEALEATKIGHAVNALRKTAPSEQVHRLAAALYRGWKALADERFRFRTQLQQQQTKADEGVKKRSSPPPPSVPPPPPLDAKLSSAGGTQADRETMAPTSVGVVEAAPPETKLHLDEGLHSAAIVRKPLTLRVISTNAAGKAEHRRVIPAEPAPAPASETATRNGGGGSKSNQQANSPAKTASHHQGTRNNAAAKRISPSLTTANRPPTALPTKPVVGSSGARKRKAQASTVFDEARLAKARTRLLEGYKEASAAKEKRKTKEINAIDALRKKARRQHPASHVRCTAAHGTGKKQAPVPCPPRMPRAF